MIPGTAISTASSIILPPPRHAHSASAAAMSSSYNASSHQMFNGHEQIPQNSGFGQPGLIHVSPFYGPNFPQQIPVAHANQPQSQQTSNSFDPRNLEIKTSSVEQTLLPLVQQISTLVNFKESIITGGKPKSERALRAALKIGTAVEAAVERFVAVGETIADENPDIQPELYDACHEARIAGSSIANLHSSMLVDPNFIDGHQNLENGVGESPAVDTTQLVRAARQLLSSVTRVLLLADRVLVKHILRAEDKIAYSLTKLEHTANFSEFVQIFTEFGGQMVDLAHRSGDRQQDLKSEKRRAQMQVARAQLERLTMLLLTSSKALLRHPDDPAAGQCRDGVFHHIRSALQLIAVCVTDGVMQFDIAAAYPSPLDEFSRAKDGPLDIGIQLTASVSIRQLCEMLEMCRMMSLIGIGVRERLIAALNALCEMSVDFTESAWTPHQQREQILDLLDECRFEMGNLTNPPPNDLSNDERLRSENIEVTVERLNRRLKDLRKQLQVVALEQIATVFRQNDDHTILTSLKSCSISGDIDGVERFLEQFRLHAEHLQEVCRLLHHISITDALHVFTGQAERNLRALAPLTLLAGRVLCVHPSSRIARENLEVFCDTWATNVNDLARLTKELDAACSGRLAAEKQAYMSLPRPGVSSGSASSSVSSIVCGVGGAFLGAVQVQAFPPPPSNGVGLGFSNQPNAIVGHAVSVLYNYNSFALPLPLSPHTPNFTAVDNGCGNGNLPLIGGAHNQQEKGNQRPFQTSTIEGNGHCHSLRRLSSLSPANSQRINLLQPSTPVPAPAPYPPKGEMNNSSNNSRKNSSTSLIRDPTATPEQQNRDADDDYAKIQKRVKSELTSKEGHTLLPEKSSKKKSSKKLSLSALFRKIKREPSLGDGTMGKKSSPRKAVVEMRENHSDNETVLHEDELNDPKKFKDKRKQQDFTQSSRSLKTEMERSREMDQEISSRLDNNQSPLYSSIRKQHFKLDQQAKEANNDDDDDVTGDTERKTTQMNSPNSAFTPYSQFNQEQQQRRNTEQHNLFAIASPPRHRRYYSKNEHEEHGEERGGNGIGQLKFNKIDGREDEPVIVRQMQEDQQREAGIRRENSSEISTNSSGYWSQMERKRSISDAMTITNPSAMISRDSLGQKSYEQLQIVDEEEQIISYEQRRSVDELEEENSPYATVLMASRAPLAKCDEEEEESEEQDEDDDLHQSKKWGAKMVNKEEPVDCEVEDEPIENEEEEFVVRMRAKKWARMTTSPPAAAQPQNVIVVDNTGSSRFEQRISRILESLQAEAESLIRLQHDDARGKTHLQQKQSAGRRH